MSIYLTLAFLSYWDQSKKYYLLYRTNELKRNTAHAWIEKSETQKNPETWNNIEREHDPKNDPELDQEHDTDNQNSKGFTQIFFYKKPIPEFYIVH